MPQSPFHADSDYVFASPILDGKKPLNSNSVQRDYLRPESIKAGLKSLAGTLLRHSYRTWLGEKGTGPEVQKELMRHSTIAMSLDGYGRGVPEANRGGECHGRKRPSAMNSLNGLLRTVLKRKSFRTGAEGGI